MDKPVVRISVRNLVEFILRSGDLDNRGGSSDREAMQKGSRLHRKIQGRMGSHYRAEVSLKYKTEYEDVSIQVEGRADGIFTEDGQCWIDEIKGVYAAMGLLMLGMFVAYMAANVWQMKNAPAEPEHEEEPMGIGKIVLLLVVGAALIALGANLLVDNGTIIAQAMGVPESVIALTFVALGTSLPELVTAITSLMKGHSDLSLGNVVGANVFNLVLVSGMSVTLAPFEIPQSATLFGINSSLVLELPVMLLVMVLLTIPALVRGKLSRVQGVALLCIYAAFCAVQFTM